MDKPGPRIIYAERLANSIEIGFDDGKIALYNALLYSMLHQAQELTDQEDREPE